MRGGPYIPHVLTDKRKINKTYLHRNYCGGICGGIVPIHTAVLIVVCPIDHTLIDHILIDHTLIEYIHPLDQLY